MCIQLLVECEWKIKSKDKRKRGGGRAMNKTQKDDSAILNPFNQGKWNFRLEFQQMRTKCGFDISIRLFSHSLEHTLNT